MGKTTNIFLLYKISKKEHLKSLAEGKVFFSCCGKYVDIAKVGCDKGQGVKYECVFAKYLHENSEEPIRRYKKLFGRDLLIEKEGNYVLFRRKSSLLIPTACFYSIDNETAVTNLQGDDRKRIERITLENQDKDEIKVDRFPLTIPQIYLDEFAVNDDSIDAMVIQPRLFLIGLSRKKVQYRKITYIDTSCEYDIFRDEIYKPFYGNLSLSEAIEKRIELFFKDKKKYAHQCELRCIIPSELFRHINQHKIIRLSNLTSLDSSKGINQNATGKDFIYGVKDNNMFCTVIMRREFYAELE